MSTSIETTQSEALYSKLARRYDHVFERAILAEGYVAELVGERMAGRTVLDVGCGNGRWVDRVPGAESYVGVDLNVAMLSEARERYPEARFVRGDMSRLPFGDGSFDGVISMFSAMGHLSPEHQEAMVDEVWRVLRPGGLAVLTNGNSWSPFALLTTLTGGRVRIEGVRVRVHSSTSERFTNLLERFRILRMETYDHSYLPLTPIKFAACLVGRDFRPAYADLMSLFDLCRYVPTLRGFGKQIVAICEKP